MRFYPPMTFTPGGGRVKSPSGVGRKKKFARSARILGHFWGHKENEPPLEIFLDPPLIEWEGNRDREVNHEKERKWEKESIRERERESIFWFTQKLSLSLSLPLWFALYGYTFLFFSLPLFSIHLFFSLSHPPSLSLSHSLSLSFSLILPLIFYLSLSLLKIY